jgi:hypothetical protein
MKRRSACNKRTNKVCNKENRATAVELMPSSSSTSKLSMYRITPHSKRYQDPVTVGVNNSACKKRRSACNERTNKVCNKENRATAVELMTSSSSVSKLSMYSMTPHSKRYQDPVTVGAAAIKLKLSASYQHGSYNRLSVSYQRGDYNINEYQPFTLEGPVVYGLTPGSAHY